MKRILIDTDVLLDLLFDRKPFSTDAERILSLCAEGTVKGYITPVIFSNLYYLLRRTASHQRVLAHLRQLLSVLDVLPMDQKVVQAALDVPFTDLEDALQYSAAAQSGWVDAIVTRNERDFRESGLPVFTPANYLISLGLGR
jgi:predicted nucleic acid-binding protein